MNCLLVAATAFEIAPFIQHYRNSDVPFYVDIQVDVAITGVGLMATTYNLQRQIQVKKPDLIIQAGIAGCFDLSVALGTVFAVKKDTVADLGVTEKSTFHSLFDMGFVKPNHPPYKGGWLVNPGLHLLKKNSLKKVAGVSVNQITTSKQAINHYTAKYKPVVESMEGAALHYVSLMENIPFMQLRGVSNYVGERNKKKWNIKDSVANLNNELIRLLNSL
ncbi:futalosine hydrolase [Terrimonas sp. NA20]|uniref:Futalosine hydrolase n=1 Tax=Terrimonas ginsenosidimutans TaxID=2908004 RepID=A0ABS9KPB9_9BACT|nr:futalosine hydrolase [Terrimonas ginsenosidimutans]MCG2614179.1 futalosine hydrolase [Terrimonas ginsenosidimutans]